MLFILIGVQRLLFGLVGRKYSFVNQ